METSFLFPLPFPSIQPLVTQDTYCARLALPWFHLAVKSNVHGITTTLQYGADKYSDDEISIQHPSMC